MAFTCKIANEDILTKMPTMANPIIVTPTNKIMSKTLVQNRSNKKPKSLFPIFLAFHLDPVRVYFDYYFRCFWPFKRSTKMSFLGPSYFWPILCLFQVFHFKVDFRSIFEGLAK